MPLPLQKAPFGVLAAFDLMTLGRNPTGFGEVLQPVADLLEFYTADRQISVNTGYTTPGVLPQTITQPINGLTRLKSVSLDLAWGAAQGEVTLRVGIRTPGNQSNLAYICAGYYPAPTGTITNTTIACVLPVPILLPNGAAILAQAFSPAAGADHSMNLGYLAEGLG